MPEDRKPIGYWLKEIDRLIEADFAELLAGRNLTRRHWQVLNTIAAGAAGQEGVDAALAPFLDEREPSTAPIVADLAARGWVSEGVLTDEGRAAFASLRERVRANRLRLTEGVTAEEYATAIGVLERMAANLRQPPH